MDSSAQSIHEEDLQSYMQEQAVLHYYISCLNGVPVSRLADAVDLEGKLAEDTKLLLAQHQEASPGSYKDAYIEYG